MMHGHATLSGPLNRKIEAQMAAQSERAARLEEHKRRLEAMSIEEAKKSAQEEIERLGQAIVEKEQQLADIDRVFAHVAPIERIIQAVCRHYHLTKGELLSWRRTGDISTARQVVMYLSRKLTAKSFPEIGRRLGGRDHTTIIHGASRIEAAMKIDADLHSDVLKLTIEITGDSTASL